MCENLRESCEPTLEVCVKLLGYVEYNFEYPEPAQTDRNHNNVFRVTVNGKTSDGEMVSQDLVIKYKGSNQDEIAKIKTTNEKYFYDALKPILENLQRDIPNLSSALFPQTVYTSKDFIILKDVTSSGDYVPVDFDCNEGADFEHIAILIGEMAKLHAVSLGWKERDSENFEKIASKLENIYLRPSLLYFIQEETMVEVLEAIEDQTVKERVKVISDYIVEKFKEIMKPSKYCVICHGNFRFENSFFIYDEDEEPIAALMVDYQSACLTSPALDFLYLMITSASTSVWSQYEQLKDVYYDCLRLSMNKFQVNVTKCYARDCFEEDIKRFAPFAIYAAIYTSKTYFNIKSIIADEIDEEYSNRKCLYEKMLNNIFGYFVQYNII